MQIKTIPVGQLQANCYVVSNESTLECVLIDPGDESNTILDYIEENKLKCLAIFLTHGHFDHNGAALPIAEETGAVIYMNERDDGKKNKHLPFMFSLPENGKNYDDGDVLNIAGLEFTIIATPGHSPGSVTIICEDSMFTGDTLFKGSCGRYDLPGSDGYQEMKSLKKLCDYDTDFDVYPGHMDATTLSREKLFNFYCREAMRKY